MESEACRGRRIEGDAARPGRRRTPPPPWRTKASHLISAGDSLLEMLPGTRGGMTTPTRRNCQEMTRGVRLVVPQQSGHCPLRPSPPPAGQRRDGKLAHLQRGGGNASLTAPQIKPLPPRCARPPFRPSAGAQPESRRAGGGGAGAPRPRGYRPGAATGPPAERPHSQGGGAARGPRGPGTVPARVRRGGHASGSGPGVGPGVGKQDSRAVPMFVGLRGFAAGPLGAFH